METYNKADLEAHLNTLLPQGFTLESFDNEFYMLSTSTDKTIRLSIGYDEYFPHDVTFSTVNLRVSFTEVEQIFHNVFVNHPNVTFGHDLNFSKTFGSVFYSVLTENEKKVLDSTKVYNDSTFNQVKPILEKMIDEALDFLNQHPTLQHFYDYGETMPMNEQADFYGQPLTGRKMIVKKLLNISDFGSYSTSVIYNASQRGDTTRASFLQDLKDYLDNM